MIKSIFPNSEMEYANFLTLLAAPFRNSKYFGGILKFLRRMDNCLLSKRSPLKWLAWTCRLTLK
jgi:hypothetical protein